MRLRAFSDAAILCFLRAGRRKEESEKPVNGARDDLSFSPVPAGGRSLLQVLVLERLLQRYERRMLSPMGDTLGAPACLIATQVLNFDLQLGLNLCSAFYRFRM